jgi:hypothetical protein
LDHHFDILRFRNWGPEHLREIVAALNHAGHDVSPRVRFHLRTEEPDAPELRDGESLTMDRVMESLGPISRSRPLIVLTNKRLHDDYFGDTDPDRGVAVITTYGTADLPREVVEGEYIVYSTTYCVIDLAMTPNLWHSETRGCIFDEVFLLPDIIKGVTSCIICAECLTKLNSRRATPNGSLIAFAERALKDVLENTTGLDNRPEMMMGTADDAPRPPKLGPGGVLKVDRELMRYVLHAHLGIDASPNFAEDPDVVKALLTQATAALLPVGGTLTSQLLQLIRRNHDTDILHLDAEKRHRDHALHQLYVALFGLLLLDVRIPVLKELVLEHPFLRTVVEERLALDTPKTKWAWYITAVLHDHAYPLSALLARISRFLRFSRYVSSRSSVVDRLSSDLAFHRDLLAPRLADYAERAIAAIGTPAPDPDKFDEEYVDLLRQALATCIFGGVDLNRLADLHAHDHGVVGAANLMLWLQHSGERESYFKHVCFAILEHNLEDELVLDAEPLAFLLKMCDTLQEWDRRVFPAMGHPVRETDAIHISRLRRAGGHLSIEKKLHVDFSYPDPDVLARTQWSATRFTEGTARHLKLLTHKGSAFITFKDMSVGATTNLDFQ